MIPVPNYVESHRLWLGSLLELAETANVKGQEDRIKRAIFNMDCYDDLTNSEKSFRIALIDWTNHEDHTS